LITFFTKVLLYCRQGQGADPDSKFALIGFAGLGFRSGFGIRVHLIAWIGIRLRIWDQRSFYWLDSGSAFI
jgi:hypothetical protein